LPWSVIAIAVEEAVLGVDVKVDELGARHAVLCQ
jgi:hypothetical protein